MDSGNSHSELRRTGYMMCEHAGNISIFGLCCVNALLDGKCHKDFTQILFGGRLLAMKKKTGGIRPIVVTCVEASYSKVRQRAYHRKSGRLLQPAPSRSRRRRRM